MNMKECNIWKPE